MNLPLFGKAIDERFLNHRLRSSSTAGIIGGVMALLLFAYHLYFDRIWNWELFAVGATVAAVKVALMSWYALTD